MTDLRPGRWEDVLLGVECDALIADPPYGERTHVGHDHSVRPSRQYDEASRRALSYSSWSVTDVDAFVDVWAPRVRGWMAIMSCSQLVPVYAEAFRRQGLCDFAPVPCVVRGMTVRMAGDGPSNWAVYLNVARRRNKDMASWGTLPGAYVVTRGAEHIGGKPVRLMEAIVRDYSRRDDLVCDPCAGLATTAVACATLGRRFVGAEADPDTFDLAVTRLGRGCQMDLLEGVS